jgi:hypothetical protein
MKPQHPKPAFEPNAFYERVLMLRRDRPAAFDSLAPVTKIALGQYEAQKREHERLRTIRDEPRRQHKRRQNAYPASTKAKDTGREKEVMPEEKESIYDKIRREAKEKQDAERERVRRVREFMEKGNTPTWLQRLNK